MRGALDVHRELLAQDVPHEVVRIRGSVIGSADDLPRALEMSPQECLAVRCYVVDDGVVAVVVHAGVVPDPTATLDALGARSLRAATADEVNAATDIAAGLVSPVALPAGVPLLMDALVAEGADVVYCPLGEGGVALAIRAPDLVRATRPTVAALSSTPLEKGRQAPFSGGARVIDLDAPRAVQRPGRRTAS